VVPVVVTRQLDSLTPAEIREAAAALMPEYGHAEAHHLVWAVAERLGSSRQDVPQGWAGNRVQERYFGRVKRALDALAEWGVLVRVGAKEGLPSGASPGGVHYYTPEAFAAAKEEADRRRAEAQAVEARWDVVRRRLSAVEVDLRPNGSLYLTDWEHLLEATGL